MDIAQIGKGNPPYSALGVDPTISSVWTFTRRCPIAIGICTDDSPLVGAIDDRRPEEPTTISYFIAVTLISL